METMSWTTVDKSTWGDGPWQDEPDKMQWPDEATGLPLLVHRSDVAGAWCGYIGVPEGHPWYKTHRYTIDNLLPDGVHGGVNFTTFCMDTGGESRGICHVPGPGEPDHVYWTGFHCSHIWDLSPAADAICRAHGLTPMSEYGFLDQVYRDIAYARDQCRLLAAQVKAAA